MPGAPSPRAAANVVRSTLPAGLSAGRLRLSLGLASSCPIASPGLLLVETTSRFVLSGPVGVYVRCLRSALPQHSYLVHLRTQGLGDAPDLLQPQLWPSARTLELSRSAVSSWGQSLALRSGTASVSRPSLTSCGREGAADKAKAAASLCLSLYVRETVSKM